MRPRDRLSSIAASAAVPLAAAPALALATFVTAAAALASLAAPAEAPAQRVTADTLLSADAWLDWERVSAPRISPDGERVVYTRSRVDRMEDSWESELWIVDADGSRNRSLVEGSSPRWSPDGSRIAYLAEGEEGEQQIHVRWMEGDARGETTQVTHVTGDISGVTWGPDGERLAFAMTEPAGSSWDVPVPSPPEGAEWTEPPRMVHRFHYQYDGRGFVEEENRHLFTVPADGGTPRQITRGEWYVGAGSEAAVGSAAIDWTPDGRTLVFDGRRGAAVDTADHSSVWAADVGSREVRALADEPGTWGSPVVSPDGRRVAFTGHGPTDLTHVASDLWVVPIEGGEKRRITGDLDRSPGDLHWRGDGSGVWFTAENEGRENVWLAPLDGPPRRVTEGPQVLSLSSVSGDGTAVGTRSSYHEPGDVVRFGLDGGEFRRLTSVHQDVLSDVALGEVEEIWYESADGTEIQGWLVKPPGFDPTEEYPLILYIHGGPHAMYDVGFSFRYQNFAANGFMVLYTNPRGSTGYGTEFAAAISQDYPSVDHEDLMAGVDTVVARGRADTERLYVTGCSGGGVLSSWAIGQTDRFAAAAVRCPVTNWISMAGTTDIPFFTHDWFDEPFWEDPEPWLEHSSLMHVGEVDTPTLLMTGEQDLRTPMGQTEEYYQALKRRGVPTVLLRFHEESHGTGSQPSNLIRGQLHMMDWFENEGRLEGITAP